MAVRQYVGARYVPKFYQNSQNPLSSEWEGNKAYEALTIVTYNNSSYTSKIPVPAGIGNPAQNPTYWVNTGDYNAQVEEYANDVKNVDNKITSSNLVYYDKEISSENGIYIEPYAEGYEGTIRKYSPMAGKNILLNNIKNNVFKIMTFNVPTWSIYYNTRFSEKGITDLYCLITSYGANVSCLQEYSFPKYLSSIPFPSGIINYTFFQHTLLFWILRYMQWGNAILSYQNGTFTKALYTSSDPNEQRGYEKLNFTYAQKTVSVYNTHLNASDNVSYRQAELNELSTVIASDTSNVIFVCGDFNYTGSVDFNTFFAPLYNLGLSPVNTDRNTWPRSNPTRRTDNIWYKGCDLKETEYITDMPYTLDSFDHIPIVSSFQF